MTTQTFKDHFSVTAKNYSRFRPDYPPELFDWLARQAPNLSLAWDCATGNGQCARQLAMYFEKVVATDASVSQIEKASGQANVDFRVATAEASKLPRASADLVTVAQAAHWFDMPAFNAEVRRVLKPGGLVAIWSYSLLSVTPALDEVIGRLYHNILGWDYWPPERKLVDAGYRTLDFSFREIEIPSFEMRKNWRYEDLIGYFGTWSAVNRYRQQHGEDPLTLVENELRAAWGKADRRLITWPLSIRAGKI